MQPQRWLTCTTYNPLKIQPRKEWLEVISSIDLLDVLGTYALAHEFQAWCNLKDDSPSTLTIHYRYDQRQDSSSMVAIDIVHSLDGWFRYFYIGTRISTMNHQMDTLPLFQCSLNAPIFPQLETSPTRLFEKIFPSSTQSLKLSTFNDNLEILLTESKFLPIPGTIQNIGDHASVTIGHTDGYYAFFLWHPNNLYFQIAFYYMLILACPQSEWTNLGVASSSLWLSNP